jgi:hypothetical protein
MPAIQEITVLVVQAVQEEMLGIQEPLAMLAIQEITVLVVQEELVVRRVTPDLLATLV